LEQDAHLVQQCLQGDGSAWEELVRRHSRRVFNVCYRFVGNRTEAEDISQEVFLRVYKTLGSYRSAHGGFATWMTSVTRNLLIDHYRRTKRDRLTDSLDDAMPVVENKESVGRRPDEQALLGELSGQVQTALTKLSPELREAVILRDLQQLEYAEIQQVLAELLMQAVGHYALPYLHEALDAGWQGVPVGADYCAPLAGHYLNMRKTTIYGGSNEIQKNIISKMILGL